MQARMKHPAMIVPGAMEALQGLARVTEQSGAPAGVLGLVHLRVSQINGCSTCVDMGTRKMKKEGETDERLHAVAVWRDTPYFSEAERAALALAECVTRLADRPDPVPDAVWQEAASHFDEAALAGVLLSIASTNVWNRLNATIRQPVLGARWEEAIAR